MIDTTRFPYEKFIYRLEHKDLKSVKVCYFECQEHLDKYLTRHQLKKKDTKIEIAKEDKKPKGTKRTKKTEK